MPRLKNASHSIDVIGDGAGKYKDFEMKRSMLASAIDRRSAVDTKHVSRIASVKQIVGNDQMLKNARRQSFDDISILQVPKIGKVIGKVEKPNELYRYDNDFLRANYHMPSSIDDKYDQRPMVNKRLFKQSSLNDDFKYTRNRLKSIDDDLANHKNGLLHLVHEQQQSHNQSKEYIHRLDKYLQAKLEHLATSRDSVKERPSKLNHVHPSKLDADHVLQKHRGLTSKSAVRNGYGVISATDLFKLRASTD